MYERRRKGVCHNNSDGRVSVLSTWRHILFLCPSEQCLKCVGWLTNQEISKKVGFSPLAG